MAIVSMAVFWLQVTEPGHRSRVVSVESRLEVGRDCEGLLLDDPTVSRRHLWLEPAVDGLVCVDMGSANGTYVDGELIRQPVALRAGNVVRIGETELLVHEGRRSGSSAGAQPATDARGALPAGVDPHERPSEVRRDLSRAASKTYVAKDDA